MINNNDSPFFKEAVEVLNLKYTKMKKTTLKIIGTIAFVFIAFFSLQMNNAEAAKIPMHAADGWCTCKNGVCQDGNLIGFRKTCGHFLSSPTDESCGLLGDGY